MFGLAGESIVVCTRNQLHTVRQLIQQKAVFAHRFTVKRRRIKLIIEAICSGLCSNENDLENLLAMLYFGNDSPLKKELDFLIKKKLISYQKDCSDGELRGTQLGRAVFASSLSPDIALQVYDDLEKAMRSLALDTELHLLYLVTPLHNDSIWTNYIDWNVYYKIWSKLPAVLQRVGKMVGIAESFILGKMQGKQATDISDMQVHLRFLSALALYDLIRECPLSDVARRFHINRGALQTLQQQSATYARVSITADMIVTFCERLGWTSLQNVLNGFSERLAFGIRKDLTELVKIEGIDGARARAFHTASITTIATLAISSIHDVAKILRSSVPFVRRRNDEGLNRWLSGEGLMTDIQAAEQLIERARSHLASSLRAIGILSDSKIDSLFSMVSSNSETLKNENDSAIINKKCEKNINNSQNSIFEFMDSPMQQRTSTVPAVMESSTENSVGSAMQSEAEEELPNHSFVEDLLNETLENAEKQMSNRNGELKEIEILNESIPEVKIKSDFDDIEELCLNFSHTSMSDETLLRFGCTQNFSENEHISQALDVAALLSNNEKLNKLQRDRKNSIDSGLPDSIEISNSITNDFSLSTTTATDVHVQKVCCSELSEKNLAKNLKNFETEEKFGINCKKNTSSPRLSLSQFSTLESIDEERENLNMLDENSGNQSVFNKSNDLFDRTYCSSASSQSPNVSRNSQLLNVTQYCSDRIRRRTSIQQSPLSPSLRSPLHKMFKSGSPFVTPPQTNLKSGPTEIQEDEKSCKTGKDTKFEITDVCECRAIWEKFLSQSKYWDRIALNVASCNGNVIGVALYVLNEKCLYIDFKQKSNSSIGIKERIEALAVILASNQYKYIYDLMSSLRFLRRLGKEENVQIQFKYCMCVQTLSYLAHYRTPNGESAISFQELVSRLTSPERAAILRNATTRIRAAISAFISFHLYDELMSAAIRLSSVESVKLEQKSVILFSQIEAKGIPFDSDKARIIRKKLTEIETEAHKIAGVHFNFNSAAEISQVLFVRLKIPPPNESNSRHYSTNKSVLKQLASNYPIAKLILEWRRMNTALNTSLPTLLKCCSDDGRIRANFSTQSCTGRVLTVHPNVQNVQKDEIIDGYSVRSLFIAPKGKILLSADYRQLEMRVLAHFSADPKLISMFTTDEDFFQTVANTWNANDLLHIKVDRNKVKQLCYGILYGMGAASLGKQLHLQKEQAQKMISSFFHHFPKVRTWMEKLLEKCRNEESVSTLMGRRRFLPHIKSALQEESSQAERQAINTCIQGSASEIFKLALLKLQKNLLGTNSSIVMQIHDEVIVEVEESLVDLVAGILKHSMTTIWPDFRVPLVVEIAFGRNWGELLEYKKTIAEIKKDQN